MSKYLIVKKYIDDMDCYSLLSNGAPDDEYDSETRKISDRISTGQNQYEIASIIAEVFNEAFDRNDTTECFIDCAAKIFIELNKNKL